MDILRRFAIPFALAISLSLGAAACTSLASGGASIATEISSSTPAQIKTLATATQAATIITNVVDVYVRVGNPDRATLLQLKLLNDQLHTTLLKLNADAQTGHSLVFDSFNEALRAFNAYATVKGISH